MKFFTAWLIVTFFAQGADASLSCKSLLAVHSVDVRSLMVKAKNAYGRGDFVKAHERLREILNFKSDDFRALGLLARVHTAEKNYSEALTAQLEVIRLETRYREASYYFLAEVYKNLGNIEGLASTLDVILKQNPVHVAALGMRIRIHLANNELNQARDLLAQKYEIDQNDKHSLGLMAELYYKKGDFASALKFVNHLLFVSQPKKLQSQIPKSFVIGLAIRAKINAAKPETADAALDDVTRIENIFTRFSPWLKKIESEAYFRRAVGVQGRFNLDDLKSSLEALNSIIRNSPKPDLSVVAAALRVQRQIPDFNELQYLSVWKTILKPNEVDEILIMAENLDWDAAPALSEDATPYGVKNNFWSSLYNSPVDGFARKSTFSRESHF